MRQSACSSNQRACVTPRRCTQSQHRATIAIRRLKHRSNIAKLFFCMRLKLIRCLTYPLVLPHAHRPRVLHHRVRAQSPSPCSITESVLHHRVRAPSPSPCSITESSPSLHRAPSLSQAVQTCPPRPSPSTRSRPAPTCALNSSDSCWAWAGGGLGGGD